MFQEEFYYQYIVKNNCFEPIIAAFVANGNRYNLLNSAVLELIDSIQKVSPSTSSFILLLLCSVWCEFCSGFSNFISEYVLDMSG